MKKTPHKTIGIIGGMGPQASVYMYKMLIDLSVEHYNAQDSIDFPDIILHSVPNMDFISNTDNMPITLEILKESVRNFNRCSVSYLSMACNTGHLLLDELQKVSQAPFVSMINEVALAVKKDRLHTVGILATPVTLQTKLYQNALQKLHIDSVVPDASEYPGVNRVIRHVIEGTQSRADSDFLARVSDDLVKKGARGIILGCTELPLAFPSSYPLSVYNSVEILCLALLERYYGTGPL